MEEMILQMQNGVRKCAPASPPGTRAKPERRTGGRAAKRTRLPLLNCARLLQKAEHSTTLDVWVLVGVTTKAAKLDSRR